MFLLKSSSVAIALLGLAKVSTVAAATCNPSDYSLPSGITLPPFLAPFGSVGIYTRLAAGITPGVSKSETPLAIRAFGYIDGTAWNCVAAYDDTYLGIFRQERPLVTAADNIDCEGQIVSTHTTDARALCMIGVYAAILPTLAPDAIEGFQDTISEFSAFPTPYPVGIDPQVKACTNDMSTFQDCVEGLAAENFYSPSIMASILAQDTLLFALDDGFNMDGTNNGTCVYNCRPYADTTGYQPKNQGFSNAFKKNWKPLLEDDGRGFFYRQEHVTPHIGTKALPRILTRAEVDSRTLSNPKYNYKKEAELVTQRLTGLDDKTKMEIELFDNKANVVALVSRGLLFRYGFTFTLERVLLFSAVYTSAELDAVILAWKEKVRHDLVRTTTVIQETRYGTPRTITTFAGPYQGVATFDASEFQPYKRVMPHAEYPSGSGCICQVNADMTAAYMNVIFNDNGANYFTFANAAPGSSNVEPGVTPASNIQLTFTSLQSIRDTCGQSRLDGGMHFTAAVPDSYELCKDFKPKVETYIQTILNGSTDLITTFVPGPPGPPGGPPGGPP